MSKKPEAPGEILELFKGGYLSVAETIAALDDLIPSPAATPASPELREQIKDTINRVVTVKERWDGLQILEGLDAAATAILALAAAATALNVRDISDEDMRELLLAKDVGSGRARLKRILSALPRQNPGAK